MSLMMNRALVILVLVGYVFCEETDPEKKPPIRDAAPPDLNSTSSVTIQNKVQNLTFSYANDHSPTKNTTYFVKPANSSSNTTQEKPLIISTSKEVRFIQNPSKMNDSLATSTIESNSSRRHNNKISHKDHTNNNKTVVTHIISTVPPTEPISTTSDPKLSEKSFDNKNDGQKFSSLRLSGPKDHSYSYFKMSKLNDVSSTIKNSTSSFNKNITSTNQKNVTPIITNSTKVTPTYRSGVTPTYRTSLTPSYRPSLTPSYRPSITPTYRPSITSTYRPGITQTYGSSVTPVNNKSTTEVAVEKMAVKEMRSMDDEKNNTKFQFFMVADYDSADLFETPQKNYPTVKDKLQGKRQGNNQQPKSLVNKEKNGHSKPYNEDFPTKKHSGFGQFQPTLQKSTTGPKLTTFQQSTTLQQSTEPVRASTVRPGRYHLNTSNTFSPLSSFKKFNSSSLNLVKNEASNPESCLHCTDSHKKYPTYPEKNKGHSDGPQAVKLLGPDGDSILGDSKNHYTVTMPVAPHQSSNSSITRVPKSGLHNNYRQHQGYLNQRGRRKPYQGLDSAGSYSSHVGGSVEYLHRPDPGLHPETRFRSRGTKKPDMGDMYNLDELESSGSSISTSHVKYETKEIHIPYAVTVEKKVSYPIHIKVDRPVPVRIDKPYPVHVEKKVPVPVRVNVPQPYPVEKEVPYPVKIPIEVPRPVEVPKPVPYLVEKPVPIQVIKEVKFPVKVPVDVPVPYKVPVHVEKRVPYFVEKKVPFEVPIAVEKPYFIEIKKPFEVPVEKPHPVTVEKKIPVPIQVIEFIKVPIPVRVPIEGYNDYLHRSSESEDSHEKDGVIGVVPAPKLGDSDKASKNRTEESKMQDRMGISDTSYSNQRSQVQPPPPRNIPNMISIEFSHPDLNQDPKVTLYTNGSEDPDSAKDH